MKVVVVNDRGAKRLRSGHPWVYRSDVTVAEGEPGEVVHLTDRRRKFLGVAFYNPRSEISVRRATREDEPIDREWFARRIRRALEYREALGVEDDAYRLLHAEADGVPGLILDRYGPYVVLQVGSAAVERRLQWVLEAIEEICQPEGVLARNDFAARKPEGLEQGVEVLAGSVPESAVVRQGGVLFNVDFRSGQKTGLFLDQRENHAATARYATGYATGYATSGSGAVLDVFSYAGGFGLHAAKSGAGRSVEVVDSSADALAAGKENARLNELAVTFTRANAFDLLRERSDAAAGLYGTIVLDPPAFAKSKRELNSARRAYKEINLRAMKLLESGGHLITCSCSYHLGEPEFKQTLREAAADAGCEARLVEWRGQAADHPESLTIPETRYLKCAVLQAH